jgi:TolA-binding protein
MAHYELRSAIAVATASTMRTRNLVFIAIVLAPVAAYATGGDEFDQPPLTLGESLDFLPGKSLGEIFLETSPELKNRGTAPDFEREVNAIADRLRTESPEALVKTADDLLAQARRHYDTAKSWCNLLHDVRDVLVASASDRAAAADYIKWRVEHRDYFGFGPEKRNRFDDEEMPAAPPKAAAELADKTKKATGPLRAHFLFLSGALTYAHNDREECRSWFERVVKEFPKHPRAEAAQFLLARCSFYDSRKGREDDISGNAEQERKRAKLRRDAEVLFERLRSAYPHGRFDADALGWLGALAYDSGNYLKALDFYIAQAETAGHPETLKSAVFMCEECLVLIAAKPEAPAAYALVARHPRIAMGFAYLVLSAPEADNYDGKFDQPAAVKKWRRTVLPKIAAAVAQQKDLYKAGDWQPRYLALLAQAASASGNQAQALQLTNSPDQLQQSDDLLLVRAIAFERAKKPAEAIETYRTLLKNFPSSTFALGARLRLALALQDNHQAGDAFVELVQLVKTTERAETKSAASPSPSASASEDDETTTEEESEKEPAQRSEPASELEQGRFVSGTSYPDSLNTWAMDKSAVYPNISGAEFEEIQEAIDTLLNFAPLPELATAVNNDRLAQTARDEVRRVIAERYLAQENFSEAQKFLADPDAKTIAAKLEKLTAAATNASGDKAEQMAQLGDAWAEARGKLLRAPLDTNQASPNNVPLNDQRLDHPADAPVTMLQLNPALTLVHRRENARSIGLKNADAELSERDELRHASKWWMNAARARPGSPLAAETRWKALESIPKLARASTYAEQLAREINGEAVSREIYQRLRTESPNSKEATRLAAYWSFPAVEKSNDQPTTDDPTMTRDANMMGYPFKDFGALAPSENDYDPKAAATWKNIEESVAALRDRAGRLDTAKIAAEVRELRDQTQRVIASAGDDYWINLLDDLTQFFSEPNITPKMQQTYVNIRLDVLHRTNLSERTSPPISTAKDTDDDVAAEIEAAQNDPTNKSIADYLEMCLLALKAGDRVEVKTDIPDSKETDGHAVYLSRDYPGMEEMARDFLAKYPQSKKREAAMFVLARSVHALSRPYITLASMPLPGAGAKPVLTEIQQKSFQREPFDPKRVLGALDNYDREFPKGRYAAEVRNLRAMTLWRMHDWPAALDLTLAQLAETTKPELQPEAAVRLANIFAALEDAQFRAELLAAIRSRPAAVPLLKKFLEASSADRSHPLRYLTSYLNDQLNLKSVASK